MQKHSADIAVAVDDSKRFTGLVSANQIQIQQRKNTTLQQIIQGKPQSVRSNTTIRDAAETLANETRVLCVVDKKQRPVGLVSRTTLLRGIVDIWDESNAG